MSLLTVQAGCCIPPAGDYNPFAKPDKEIEFKVALPGTGYAKELEERRWYSLELAESGPGGKPKGILQRDGDTLGPELERYLVRIEPIPSDALENLKRLHSWEALQKPSPQVADINQNVLFVGVVKVGQGRL